MTAATDPTRADDTMHFSCSCGSGLDHALCCGLVLWGVRTSFGDGRDGERIAWLRRTLESGDHVAARATAKAVIKEVPGHREALHVLFSVLREAGEWDAASAVVDRVAHIHLNDAVSRTVAVQHLLSRGEFPRAHAHARMLVRLAPEAVIAHYLMGKVFLGIHNPQAAEHHFRIAADLPIPRGPQVAASELELNLGIAMRHQGRIAEARAIFVRLAEQDAYNATLLLAWADAEEAGRDFERAAELLVRAEAASPDNPHVVIARAALYRRMKQPDRALDLLEASEAAEGAPEASHLLQKGQTLDSMGRYDEAFAAFVTFKRWLRESTGKAYRAEEAGAMVGALRDFFTPERYHLFPLATLREDSPQPIFIIGFPRSGTTLVEQTLSAHPNIAAGDELPIIGTLTQQVQRLLGSPLAYPQALSELWFGDRAGHVDSLRDHYLNEAIRFGAIDPAKRWFTDKMPLNETDLGLIHLLFPRSPVIHLVRHPLDVVLSVFSNALTHGYFCAYDLETAARHFALIADLIAQYRSAMPIQYHAVRYEDLVMNQEAVVKAMLAFIGEPFDPRTLDFHANARAARTASYAQVTEKLYTRSCYRYRNYLKQLEPIVPILQPAIDRLGYTVEV